MGFRFYRRFTLLRGLRPNLSRSGLSASVGRRGAWLTFGRNGARATVGIPGTGISYTQTAHPHQPHPEHQDAAQPPAQQRAASAGAWLILLVLLAIAGGIGWLIGIAIRYAFGASQVYANTPTLQGPARASCAARETIVRN
jgi:hypothetical protein